jgi:hypothetical protein
MVEPSTERVIPGSIARVDVSLLYFEDCPNWQVAHARLEEALRLSGHAGQRIERVLVTSVEQAEALHFVGSPTVLIDGEDPFRGDEPRPFGLTCRVYPSDAGLGGSPSIDELIAALAARA